MLNCLHKDHMILHIKEKNYYCATTLFSPPIQQKNVQPIYTITGGAQNAA